MLIRQWLRNSARFLWRRHKRFWAKKLSLSETDRIFIVSPHADDETLGAGGLIYIARMQGIEVKVVCINDGRYSHSPDLIDNKELVRLREQEFYSSLEILGVSQENAIWMGYVQEEPFDDDSWIEPTLSLINEFHPTTVILPDIYDDHPDHALIGSILFDQIKKKNPDVTVLLMPVWHIVYGPKLSLRSYIKALRRPCVALNISQGITKKEAAWENYKTQSTVFREIEGWNFLDKGFSKHHMNNKEIYFTNE